MLTARPGKWPRFSLGCPHAVPQVTIVEDAHSFPSVPLMNAILLPALLFVCAADDKLPAPQLPLGRDTTYVVGPLDKHGYIDYEAALNAELSKGITPKNNANALLLLAFGPTPEGSEMPPEYFKWLDIPVPPKVGDYFLGSGRYVRDQLGITGDRLETFYDFQTQATRRPWAAKECPPLAEWLKANDKPLKVVAEAVQRPRYFNPLVSRRKDGEPSNLINTLLPTVQKCREFASALTARAMLRLKEGQFDAAWDDILTCHRLGRHLSRGATLIESLVGIAISQIASNATLAYLEHANLTSKQVRARLKELQALPKFTPVADKIDIGERMVGLDALQNIRRGGGAEGEAGKPTAAQLKALAAIDWVPAMRSMNAFYDRVAAAMRIPNRAAREKEFDKIEKALKEATKKAGAKDVQTLIADGKAVGKELGTTLVSLLAPAVRKVQQAHDRAEQTERNLHIAFALAAYRKDTGRYPAKLADLAPKYLAAVPNDLFADKPLIYKPAAAGYLFYSVGPNGKDDGGAWYDDNPPGDDPGVRMPSRLPKK